MQNNSFNVLFSFFCKAFFRTSSATLLSVFATKVLWSSLDLKLSNVHNMSVQDNLQFFHNVNNCNISSMLTLEFDLHSNHARVIRYGNGLVLQYPKSDKKTENHFLHFVLLGYLFEYKIITVQAFLQHF